MAVPAVVSCVASRNKRGRSAPEPGSLGLNNRQSLPYFCLTLAGRTPGRNSNSWRGAACCGPPEGRRPARATQRVAEAPHNFLNFGLSPTPPRRSAPGRQGRRFYEPQKQHFLYYPIRWVRPRRAPHAPLMRRPCRGRRFRTESRYSLSAQIPAQSSAQRGAKTGNGFRTRRTSAAQSSPQFSVPCQPHCGSACAPPRLPSPAAILAGLASANRQNMPVQAGGRQSFCAPLFFRAPWEILSKHASAF